MSPSSRRAPSPASSRQGRRQVRRPEAGLAGIAVDVDLEEDGEAPLGRDGALGREVAQLADDPVEPAGELKGMDGLDRGERLERAAGLVVLERPDEVPLPRPDRRHLGLGLLDAVLPEQELAGGDRRADALGRDGLGHRDERGPCPGRDRTRAQAAAISSITRPRAASNARTASTSGSSGTVLSPAPAGVAHLRRRKLGISSSSASTVARRGAGTVSPTDRSVRTTGMPTAAGRSSPRDRSLTWPSPEATRWRSSSSRKSRSRPAREPPLTSGVSEALAPRGGRSSRLRFVSKPVAMTVIWTSSPSRSLKLVPKMMFASGSAAARISSAASVDLEEAEVGGARHVEQHPLRAVDVDLEQRAGDGLAGRLERPGCRRWPGRCP